MIPTKSHLLSAAGCEELSDEMYDRHWENILMKPLVSMRSGRKWLTFGSCRIPYQLGGEHHPSYWIRVSPFTDDGYEDKSKEEWHLFDDAYDVVDKADEVSNGVRAFGTSVHTYLWGWD
jgi:hypothetical protein